MENQARNTILSKTLSIIIALIIICTIAALIYTVTAPPVEKFTEFYILSIEGKATGYPKRIKVGEEAGIIIGISNQEQKAMSYLVDIKIDGVTAGGLGPISLENREKHEQIATFTPDKTGDNQKVEFLLFKQGESEVYESIHLWVDIQ